MTSIRDQQRRPGRRARLAGLGLLWLVGLVIGIAGVTRSFSHPVLGLDSRAYWLSGHQHPLYAKAPGKDDAYLYSPAFASIVWPLTRLPLVVFETVWTVVETAAFAWLLRPLGWKWGVPLFAVCFIEALEGDIYGLLGVALVLGLRFGGLWAVMLLTKIAPGVGLLWFALRREWRPLGWAVAVTVAIAAVSFALTPAHWTEWLSFLVHHRGEGSAAFPVRFAVAVLTVVIAARTDRPWLLAVALMLAMPRFGNLPTYTMLAAIPRLATMRPSRFGGSRHLVDGHQAPAPGANVSRR